MTQYLEISTAIARRIGSGDLPPNAELPSIRELAHTEGATTSTVARAYRHLAEAGIILGGARTRARVAPDGPTAARRLLDPQPAFRLAGSDDPALEILLQHAGPAVVAVGTRGSFHGLTAVARGNADGAAVHLQHSSGIYNTPFAHAALRGRRAALIHLWQREQGLIVPRGNPRNISTPDDLRGRRVAKRAYGSGTRVLLDRLTADAGLDPEELTGPEAGSHLEVALTVASGAADAGLGVRAAAADLDLDFIPLTWESFDIILDRNALEPARPLVAAARDHALHAALTDLGGYDLTAAGTVETVP